jgi:hypothetical protein
MAILLKTVPVILQLGHSVVAKMIDALCFNPEGCGFESR